MSATVDADSHGHGTTYGDGDAVRPGQPSGVPYGDGDGDGDLCTRCQLRTDGDADL